MATLNDILIQVNSFFALDGSAPTGADATLLTYYANRAVSEAGALAQMPEFKKQYFVATSTLSSFTLPSGFRDFTGMPRVLLSSGNYDEFPKIEPEERYLKSSADKYCYLLGNQAEGFTATFNSLTANATLSIDYQRYPSGFATLTSVCELNDEMYVVRKIESYILQSRVDERATAVDADASRMLQNSIGRNMRRSGGENRTPRLSNYGTEE